MLMVTADFFCILSLTLTKCCQCLNITIKKLNVAVVTEGVYCKVFLIMLIEKVTWSALRFPQNVFAVAD